MRATWKAIEIPCDGRLLPVAPETVWMARSIGKCRGALLDQPW